MYVAKIYRILKKHIPHFTSIFQMKNFSFPRILLIKMIKKLKKIICCDGMILSEKFIEFLSSKNNFLFMLIFLIIT